MPNKITGFKITNRLVSGFDIISKKWAARKIKWPAWNADEGYAYIKFIKSSSRKRKMCFECLLKWNCTLSTIQNSREVWEKISSQQSMSLRMQIRCLSKWFSFRFQNTYLVIHNSRVPIFFAFSCCFYFSLSLHQYGNNNDLHKYHYLVSPNNKKLYQSNAKQASQMNFTKWYTKQHIP